MTPCLHVINSTSAGLKRLNQALSLWSAAQRKLEPAIGAARAAWLRGDQHAVSQMEIAV